ncbi:hypothetical protein ACRAR1_15275 [Streptomyces sanyensis]|uniref:hypothetical protein n=1 Tax=Streptomyces sanyensis TaxID=568869 RepID=UPI003D76BB18
MTTTTARATGRIRQRARQAVPAERFTQLYVDEHRSLQQIATFTGFSRGVLTKLAKEYGIPLRDGPQDYERRGTIDRDWLIEQYVHCRRTLPDLARETGMGHREHGPLGLQDRTRAWRTAVDQSRTRPSHVTAFGGEVVTAIRAFRRASTGHHPKID